MNFGAKIYGKFSSFSFSAHENTACALSFQCYAYKKLQQNVVLEGKFTKHSLDRGTLPFFYIDSATLL